MISSATGVKVFISTSVLPANLAAYQALTWTEVGEVEDAGEFGDQSDSIDFVALSDARKRKLKGPRDAGSMTIVCGDDMLDDGQIAMEAAEASPLDYNFKVLLNDAVTIAGDPSEHYFRGKVMGKRRNVGNASNVIKRTFTVGVNTAIISTDPS